MAVYTEVTDDELNAFIAQYDLGAVLSCKGIAEGVENSNFLLVTERGPYILTLYEKRTRREDLPFFLGLMEHLADKGIACPLPVVTVTPPSGSRARRALSPRRRYPRTGRRSDLPWLEYKWPSMDCPLHCYRTERCRG